MLQLVSFVSKSALALGVIALLAISGCGDGDANVTLESLELTPGAASSVSGTTLQFLAVARMSDGSAALVPEGATWSSSDPSVATVDQAGLALAVSQGTTQISLRAGEVSIDATMSVTDSALESIALTPSTPSIAAGTTQAFAATATFSDATTRDVRTTVVWSSSDESVATVDGDGVATSVAPGRAVISATSGEVSTTASLTVTEATLVRIELRAPSTRLNTFSEQRFSALGVFSDFTIQDISATVAWSSSDTSTALIGATGVASGVEEGSATFSATQDEVTSSIEVSVIRALLAIDNVLSGSPQMFAIDPSTGVASHIGPTTDRTSAIAFDASGTLVSLSDNGQGLVTYDLTTGGVTVLDDENYSYASDMAIAPDGRIYGGMNNEGLYEAVAESPRTTLIPDDEYENTGALAANDDGLLIFQDFDVNTGNFVSFNPDSLVRTDLGFGYDESFGRIKAMTFIGDTLYAITQEGEGPDGADDLVGCSLITISPAGVVSLVGNENGLPTDLDALAYEAPTAE